MKVLYVSDLDGTLLRSNAKTSEYTNQVYSYISGREKCSYVLEKCNTATKEFLLTRKGDTRENPIEFEKDLGSGDVFYFTCIDKYDKLEPIYIHFKEKPMLWKMQWTN